MNITSINQSEANKFPTRNLHVIHILTFLFLVIEMLGILGNILVIIAVEFDARMRRSLTNQLIIRVASCDLLILLFNIPDIVQFVSSNNGTWILNEFACKFLRSTLVLAQYASVLTMCALTIERFIGIVYPLRSKFLREKKQVIVITLIVWIFSFLCASPNLIYLRVITHRFSSRRSCQLIYSEENFVENRRGYILHKSTESIIFYFLPLLLQIYCYSRIARRLFYVDESLRTSFRTAGKLSLQRTQVEIDDDEYIDLDENPSTKYTRTDSLSRSQRVSQMTNPYPSQLFQTPCRTTITYTALQSRRNVIKMLFIVVLIYFISFSPQVLVFLLFESNAIRHVPRLIQTPYFVALTMLLVTISSASNPIVYAIFCSKFRQSFANILRRIFCCQKKKKKFHYQTNHGALSLQQIPRATYRFNGRMSTDGKKNINKDPYAC